jgi:hypothetical protein
LFSGFSALYQIKRKKKKEKKKKALHKKAKAFVKDSKFGFPISQEKII